MARERVPKTSYCVLLLVCLLLASAGCKERQPVIVIETPEAKLSPALIGVVSVFMKINNTGNGQDALVSARTKIPGAVAELHDIEDGKMVKVEQIAIPADSQVLLRAARQHIMIFGMPKDTGEGSEFDLVLTFERSGVRTVPLEITRFSTLKRFRN